jgi:hypothetical protein
MDTEGSPSPQIRSRDRLWFVAISSAFSIITSYYHQFIYISQPNVLAVVKDHFDVIGGNALAPTQYRLAPYFLAQWVLNLTVAWGASNDSITLLKVYLAIQIVVMAAAYYLLLVLLTKWFDPARALLGLCFMVAVNPLAEYQYFHQPGDCWSLLFFLLGYLAMASGRDGWLALILLAGTPFRETIALLIPAYVALRWGRKSLTRLIPWTLLFILAFLIPFAAIRLHYHQLANYVTTHPGAENVSFPLYNLTHIDGWLVLFLYFNILWPAIFLKWRSLPVFFRRVSIILPLFFASIFLWGRFAEGRLYLPILPLFLPAGLLMLGPVSADADHCA